MTSTTMVNNTNKTQPCNKSTRVIRYVTQPNRTADINTRISNNCTVNNIQSAQKPSINQPIMQQPPTVTEQLPTVTEQPPTVTEQPPTVTNVSQACANSNLSEVATSLQNQTDCSLNETLNQVVNARSESCNLADQNINSYENFANSDNCATVNCENNISQPINSNSTFNLSSNRSGLETTPANNRKPQVTHNQLYLSHTNLIVKSVAAAVEFYVNAFNWSVVKVSEKAAVMQYNNYTFYLVAEQNVIDYFGYTAVSPQTSGHSPAMTTTLLCDDVISVWNNALAAGAIPVKSPYKKANGSTCATLVGTENYVWFITDSNNFFC
ncbi:MAG: VOC family protein [Pseudomonadota bacterium]|nr:VOC family protein [Pseudomonadota bacterium]